MYVRLTLCKFIPERIREAKKVYNEEVAPLVMKQRGNISIRLLEPDDIANDFFISFTEWSTREDATNYEKNGIYKECINKLKDFFIIKPILKSYSVEQVRKSVTNSL